MQDRRVCLGAQLADHVTSEAGKTRVSRDYWLVRERPELFKPADNRDACSLREHGAGHRRCNRATCEAAQRFTEAA